jgi:hypothetical protein
VDVVRTEYVEVPIALTQPVQPQAIPDTLTYAQALTLWAKDRSTIVNLNAQLTAIRNLKDGER